MKFVKKFDFFGVEASQIPCITGSGAPTAATEGAVGCLYMDTDSGSVYKCTAAAAGAYTWQAFGGTDDATLGDIEAALDSIIAIQNQLIGGESA